MNKRQYVTTCVLLFLFLIPAAGYSQVQEYISLKNVKSSKHNLLKRKTSTDTMLVSIFANVGYNYKTLLIRPKGNLEKFLDNSVTLHLVRKKSDTQKNIYRIVVYEGEYEGTKATVSMESHNEVLSAIMIVPDSTDLMNWIFTELRPVYRE